VKSKADPIPIEYGDTVLMFTDLRLAADGTMPPSTMVDQMNGRVGDHLLVNGQKNPSLALQFGEKRRLRLFNATNARYLRLAFENANMVVIGTDGGLLEAPVPVDEILLTPAERVELIVTFEKPGAAILRTLDYERGWMGPGKPEDAGLALLTAKMEMGSGAMSMGSHDMDMGSGGMAMGAGGMKMEFLINGVAFDMNRVDVVSKVGDVERWEVVNQSDMDHPFHVHGTQFQVVEHELSGKVTKPAYLSWKDTVNVVQGETVRLLLRQDQPGRRMYHCHILEHEDLGMMGVVDVQA